MEFLWCCCWSGGGVILFREIRGDMGNTCGLLLLLLFPVEVVATGGGPVASEGGIGNNIRRGSRQQWT